MAYEDTLRSLRLKSGKLGNVKSKLVAALPGTVAEFGFPFTVETSTVQAAGYAKVYDVSAVAYLPLATSSSGAGYTANFQCFPDTEAIGDYVMFGAASPFGVLRMQSSQAATWSANGTIWEYLNADGWQTLPIIWDDTDTTAYDGLRSFQGAGNVIFSAPQDWAAVTVDSQSAYWVRCRLFAATMTQEPLVVDEHGIITAPTGISVPYDCEIVDGKFTFITNSGSNDHTDVILCNLTDGTCSAIEVITKALKQGVVIDFGNQVVSADDDLAFYVTDEDGTTEYADGIVEFTVTRK